jgi:hypothetical protein
MRQASPGWDDPEPGFIQFGRCLDYLVRVATADLAAYQVLRDEQLATLPGVHRLSSTIVMKQVVEERPFSL